MTAMMIMRNHFYAETKVGLQKMAENKGKSFRDYFRQGFFKPTLEVLAQRPKAIMVMLVIVLFNVYLPIGTFSSLYFAPYVTDVLGIGKSTVSILGGVYSVTMLVVFIFINPVITRFNNMSNMVTGLLLQVLSLLMLITIPQNSLIMAILCVALFAIGFSIFKPFVDSLLAEVTEGKERAGIYAIVNALTCVVTAVIGFVSGYLYSFNPRAIYIVSILILFACVSILIWLKNGGSADDDETLDE